MLLMNRFNARAVATLVAGKEYDGSSLYLHKRKNGGVQWLYRYTIKAGLCFLLFLILSLILTRYTYRALILRRFSRRGIASFRF
ncbi:hypothetical protein [Bartonella machadoae]|uniref:hypothetical protein n=1 Tax=Bartonella machadoae TaxID=2893471 RepID=UPI001F4C7DEF|nr:hypothetical protein [Bartonella machadoae]UNE54566.1 hypothetical protein LNM86_01265 [Bartonella machadoae]